MSLSTRRRTHRTALAASLTTVLALPLLALTVPSATAHDDGRPDAADGSGARPVPAPALREMMRLKGRLARYRSPAAAVADGYLPSAECNASPTGGMGHHYVNPSLMGPVDPERPPILVYVPGTSGLTLGAVEWFVPDADQDPATDGDRPDLLGVPFDGPMPGHEPGMPVHYDLHAWLFRHNPDGLLAAFNPTVRC
ncbi:hypothetical protein NYO98_12695 [Nocardioides sp. STR2]|uniref:Triacylglycerol lipase n=1 Tax=Nocardioides pini TaxID=2975053 RepID=A0ABT4CDU8_9ACTN|nr:hypothetical protein [Nocardioides pini]MCY4727138.1 hypothetical protein [Nocardioides pini]